MASVQALNKRIQDESAFLKDILRQMQRVIVGQDDLVRHMLVALLADGHALIEGVPGLAKQEMDRCGDQQGSLVQFQDLQGGIPL